MSTLFDMSSDPCAACSWTTERQQHFRYERYVKLFYEAGDRGVWSLGSKLILKDRGGNLPTREVPNTQFAQEQTSIPVSVVVDSWEEDDTQIGAHTDTHTVAHILILIRRIPGKPLQAPV